MSLKDAQSTTSIHLLTNIFNLVSVRLDSTNYILWRFQISPLLKAHKIYGYVDGPISAPEAKIGDPEVDNPEFLSWFERDQALLTLLNATLSQEALAYVVGCITSKDVWDSLEKIFSSSSRTHVVGLKTELQSITKKSGEAIDTYIQRIKKLVNQLAAVSVKIDSEDIVIYAVNGLPNSYNMFKTSLRTRLGTIQFDELHALLRTEELALEGQSKIDESSALSTMAMYTNRSSSSRGSWRGPGHGRGRGNGGCGRNSY